MDFEAKEVCITQDAIDYKISVCFNGEFYHARIINPPSPDWALSGLGQTENEAVNDLMLKVNQLAA